MPSDEAMIDLPMLGKIAAGTPIEALRDDSARVVLPSSMITAGITTPLKFQAILWWMPHSRRRYRDHKTWRYGR